MRDLIERLKGLHGPSREVDAEIMFDLFATPVGRKDGDGPSGYLWLDDNPSWAFGMRFPGKDREWFAKSRKQINGETLVIERDGALVLMNSLRIPRLTASIDDALAVTMKVFPGTEIEVTNLYGVARAACNLNADPGPSYGEHECGSIPIAILVALLSAVEARNEP